MMSLFLIIIIITTVSVCHNVMTITLNFCDQVVAYLSSSAVHTRQSGSSRTDNQWQLFNSNTGRLWLRQLTHPSSQTEIL